MLSILIISDTWSVLLHLAFALAITALVLDLFFNTEILAQISAFIISLWLSIQVLTIMDVHPFWYILVFSVVLLAVELVYFFVWRAFVVKLVAGGLTRNSSKEITDAMAGFRGPVEVNGNQFLLHYLEEYLAIDPSCTAGLKEGMMVEIVEERNGSVVVKPVDAPHT